MTNSHAREEACGKSPHVTSITERERGSGAARRDASVRRGTFQNPSFCVKQKCESEWKGPLLMRIRLYFFYEQMASEPGLS